MTLTQIKPLGLSKPVDLADNEKIRLGTGQDLEIFFDGTHSRIKHTPATGDLVIQSDDLYVTNAACYVGTLAWSASNGTAQSGQYIIGTYTYHA